MTKLRALLYIRPTAGVCESASRMACQNTSQQAMRRPAALMLLVLVLTLMTAGCGDPGTGGSGIPTGTADSPANSSGVGGSGSGLAATTPLPLAATAAELASLSGLVESTASSASQPPDEIIVNGTRISIAAARFLGFDGSARSRTDVLAGVPVVVTYPVGQDRAGAATAASGTALDAWAVVITDPMPGRWIADQSPAKVLFDDGRLIAVSVSAVASGNPGNGSQVRAWIASEPVTGQLLVSRVEPH